MCSKSSLAVAWQRFPTADGPLPLGSRTVPGLSYHLLTSHNCSSQLTQSTTVKSQVEVKVMLQPTVSPLVCLDVKPPSGAQDQIFVTVRQLRFVDVGRPL
jgi:hypothetical protein